MKLSTFLLDGAKGALIALAFYLSFSAIGYAAECVLLSLSLDPNQVDMSVAFSNGVLAPSYFSKGIGCIFFLLCFAGVPLLLWAALGLIGGLLWPSKDCPKVS